MKELVTDLLGNARSVRGMSFDSPQGNRGLCAMLRAGESVARYELLQQLFRKWPEYSGCHLYPVPSDVLDDLAVDAYYRNLYSNTMWTGEYGASRRRLLDFIIKELEGML